VKDLSNFGFAGGQHRRGALGGEFANANNPFGLERRNNVP
jgi:hypothetical protein